MFAKKGDWVGFRGRWAISLRDRALSDCRQGRRRFRLSLVLAKMMKDKLLVGETCLRKVGGERGFP